MIETHHIATAPIHKIVVINGTTEVLGMLESALDARRYDTIIVHPDDRAYSQIRRLLPHLIILCARIDRLESFQLLTMLKLDPTTCDIPVLTYTTKQEGQDFDAAASQFAEDEVTLQVPKTPPRMN